MKERDLAIARFRAQRAHHHGRAAPEAPQHFCDGINLFRAEGDDGAARGQARQLARADMGEGGKTRAADDLDARDQGLHKRFERGRPKQHRLFPTARVQQAVGEDMPTLAIGGKLRLVQRHEGPFVHTAWHRFHGAAQISGIGRFDPLFARDQRDLLVPLDGTHAVVNLARQQPQRKSHRPAGMRDHSLDREMRLARVGGSENRGDRAILHKAVMAVRSESDNR